MFWIILSIIVLLVALVAGYIGFVANGESKKGVEGAAFVKNVCLGVVAGALGVFLLDTMISSVYTQDPGQASVLVSFTGNVDGINYESGLHFKAPWTNRVEYDVRNNTLSYVGTNGNTDSYTGGDVSGPQITFQDANGVTGNIDLNLRYSVRGNAVGEIYNEYKTQQEFVNATLAPDVRAKTREILAEYSTSEVYSERGKVQDRLYKALQESWDGLGVDVEEIYLQEVRYPETITGAFATAQSARTELETVKANQEKARVEAETNRIKTEALSKEILQEKLIDAMRNSSGNTYIIGEEMLSIGVN